MLHLSPSTDLVSKGSFSSLSLQLPQLLPQLKDMSLYIDYIYLDVDERRRFAQQSHEYLIDQLQFGLQQTLSTANARIDLTLNHPVKELIWVFQDARKTDCAVLQLLLQLVTLNLSATMILQTDAVYKLTVKIVLMSDMVTTSGKFNLINITQEVVSGLLVMKSIESMLTWRLLEHPLLHLLRL
jgi:hypothetical protein